MTATRFEGQQAIVTGGGSGIGRAIALALAERGARVRIIGRDERKLAEVAGHHRDRITPIGCDLHDAKRWEQILNDGPDCDILINNAAMSIPTDLADPFDNSLAEVLAVNFGSAWTGCRTVARGMASRGGGRIVNITSVHGRMAERGSTAYGVGKAALEQLTRCLAVEWAQHGILVNAVAPGFVDTPMSRVSGVNELESDWFRTHYLGTGRIPLKRAARPEEMVAPVLFFASRDNTYVTGQVLLADGGLSLTL